MRTLVLIAGGALVLSASAATAQSASGAQSMPPAHAQHHPATGKHSGSAHGQRCCCEKEMHQMMRMMHEMMKMHKGGMRHDRKMPKQSEPSH